MKRLFLSLLCLIGLFAFAQQNREARDINVENFPKITFIWNQYNPEILNADNFSLSEDGKNVAFSCSHISNPEIPERNKTVLFLWEDMPADSKQFNFTQSFLYYFFKDDLANKYPNDIFNVAVFNRQRTNQSFLKPLLPDFTNDKTGLANAIAQHIHETGVFDQPESSDLYTALDAGLELLAKSPANNIKVLFIITKGLNVRMPGAKDDYNDIIREAKKQEIPVYVIKDDDSPRYIEQIAKKTYGEVITTTDAAEARTMLLNLYSNIDKRHYGQDYAFTFESSHKQDGQQYALQLRSPDRPTIPAYINYTAPERPFSQKMLDNWFIILLIIVLLGLFAFLGVWYFKKKKLEDDKRDKEREEKYQEKIKDVEHAKSQIQQESEDRQKAWQAHQKELEEEQRQAKEKEREEQMSHLMYTKNLFPRLQCVDGDNTFTFHVQKSVTTIGRNDTNDLILSNNTVSGSHAKMVFTGSGFEIHDLGSSNKVIVNGLFIEQTMLRNGDIIGLGEALITFYI